MLTLVVVAVLIVGVALGVYGVLLPHRTAAKADRDAAAVAEPPPAPPLAPGWERDAGEEFAGLSDAARCDLVFAVAALDDERSRALLERALDDRAEAVALAAAHALATHGRIAAVRAYATAHPGERAQRILDGVALLEGG